MLKGFYIKCLLLDDAKTEHFFTPQYSPRTNLKMVNTWLNKTELPVNDEGDERRWCYCKESKVGDMVACDNVNCTIKCCFLWHVMVA